MIDFTRLVRFAICVCLSFSWATSKAQTGGLNGYQSLQQISSSRVAALGGNAISLRDGDLNVAWYNPALLDSTTSRQIALSFTRFIADAGFGHVGYAQHIEPWGVDVMGGIQFTSYGTMDETNAAGEIIGSFNAGDYVIQLGASRRIDSLFQVGLTTKYIFSQLAGFSSSALAFDLGANYRSENGLLMASLLLRNVGFVVNPYTSGNTESVPFEIQLAASYKLANAPFRFNLAAENLQQGDLTPEPDGPLPVDPLTGEPQEGPPNGFGADVVRHLVFGTEVLITKNFHLRGGYNFYRRAQLAVENRPGLSGFSFGLGIRVTKLHVSYARTTFNQAGALNHFTLGLKFADLKKIPRQNF